MANKEAADFANHYSGDIPRVLAYFSFFEKGAYEVDIWPDLNMDRRESGQPTVQYLHRIKAVESETDRVQEDGKTLYKRRVWLTEIGKKKLESYPITVSVGESPQKYAPAQRYSLPANLEAAAKNVEAEIADSKD